MYAKAPFGDANGYLTDKERKEERRGSRREYCATTVRVGVIVAQNLLTTAIESITQEPSSKASTDA